MPTGCASQDAHLWSGSVSPGRAIPISSTAVSKRAWRRCCAACRDALSALPPAGPRFAQSQPGSGKALSRPGARG